MTVVVSVLFVCAALYGLICVGVFLVQDRLLFRPTSELERTPDQVGLEFEEQWLEAGPGERIHAWRIRPAHPRARVLFLHGNEGNVADRLDSLQVLHSLGLDVLALDYPGYGRSTGTPTEEGCYRAARQGFEALRAEEPTLPLIVWGRSMGGGVASSLIGEAGVSALILEATFTCMADVAQMRYPWLPARHLTRLHFPTIERLAGIDIPVLVVHSREDEMLPFAHGEALALAAGPQATFVPITGSHGRGYFTSGEAYLGPLRGFLDEHVPLAREGV